jgi:hypothetical protein
MTIKSSDFETNNYTSALIKAASRLIEATNVIENYALAHYDAAMSNAINDWHEAKADMLELLTGVRQERSNGNV